MRYASMVCALALAAMGPARADDFITYTLSGMFQGSLTNPGGTTPLPAESFSIALTADLQAVENNINNNIFETPVVSSVNFTLGSFGSGTYADSIQLVEYQGIPALVFQNQTGGFIAMSAPAFATYNLETLLDLSGVTVSTNMRQIVTGFGTLNIPRGAFSQATFSVTQTPEPASLLLVGMCLAGLVFWRVRPALRRG